ncbi:MAG: S1C family serine protease [Terriglobia bacterium]
MAKENSLRNFSDELAGAVERASQFVVAVHGRPHVPSSGILWQDGVVVTTDHTLRRDSDITITLPNGTNLPATLAGRDPGTDLAVLKIGEGSGDAAKFASDASIKTGNFVYALGRRTENGISASFGIVSAVGGAWRTWRGGQAERFIRPDVTIYPGFSGGALIDVEGLVIGLNTSGLTRGSGVTLPVAAVTRVAGDLLVSGRVRRGYLGIGMHPVQLPDGREGLIMLSVEPEGPAAKAGVLIGDVLLTLEGQPVTDTDDVQAHLGGDKVGKPIAAELLRGGVPVKADIVPAERKQRTCR